MPKKRDVVKRKGKAGKKIRKKQVIPYLLKAGYPVDNVRATFIYSDSVDFNLSTNNDGYGILRCNSIYDPEGTHTTEVTGERNAQPRYYDQVLGVLYGKYRVYSSKLELTYQTTGSADTSQAVIWVYNRPSDSGDSPPVLPDFVDEHPFINRNGQSKTLGLIRSSAAVKKITSKWNENTLSVKNKMENEAAYNANPDYNQEYVFGITTASGAVDAFEVHCRLKITYYCMLSHPYYANIST